MKNKIGKCFIGISILLLFSNNAVAQKKEKQLTIDEAIQLAIENHQQLKVAAKDKDIALKQTEVAKQQQLPNIVASATAGYLGNTLILDKDFSKVMTKDMPHFSNTYSVQASELLFKGGLISKSIKMSSIREQLVTLDFEKDLQAVKLLVVSNYLDIYKLHHQEKVYQNNKQLAEIRLENVKKFYNQGMMTRNEVIRGELVLQNIEQGLLVITNNLSILNYNLDLSLGLDEDTEIIPIENTEIKLLEGDLSYYIDLADKFHPMLAMADKSIDIAEQKIGIANSDKYPTLAAVAGYNMQRPITTTNPVTDMYANTWTVGASLSYSLDNLFKTKNKVNLEKLNKNKAEESKTLVSQNVQMGVNAAFTKYNEAIQNAGLLKKSQSLAQENYRIIEAKYLNQLAIQAEMIDATNAKLEAELQYANAEINVLFQYYNLLKSTGTL